MSTIEEKIEQLNMENTDIESAIKDHKTKLYDNKKKIKSLLETKALLDE